jgi:oxygen-independent coproporphyrinogen-3 oxidase
MTGLRTIWGVSLNRIKSEFGQVYLDYLLKQADKFLNDFTFNRKPHFKTTKKGKF